MTIPTLQLKLKQRLNKLDSQDYDNIEKWQIVEAFNKAQVEWCRRNLHGNNLYKEGDEQSKRRVDDLQVLLVEQALTGVSNDDYFQSINFPSKNNYLEYKRVSCQAVTECCPEPRKMTVYLAEEANVDIILRDSLKNPSFEWSETFCTLINGQVRIYKNEEFDIVNPVLTYYRKPVYIQISNSIDPYTGNISTVDIEPEFKDDLVEIMIDETAAIIAGDTGNYNTMQVSQQTGERNN